MSQRVSEADVLHAFELVKKSAYNAGVYGAPHWELQKGNSSYHYQWRIKSRAGFIKSRDLGSTKREAYTALMHMNEAFWLVTAK